MKLNAVFVVAFLLSPSATAVAQSTVNIPKAKPAAILLDGQIAAAEWAGAREITIGGPIRMLAKESLGDVYLAFPTNSRLPRPVDIYLQAQDGKIYQLHASAQIGERHLTPGEWNDTIPAWRWGNHVGWMANEAKIDSERPRDVPFSNRTFGADGVEFQIRRSQFPGKQWKMRVDVGVFPGNEGTFRFPAGATDDPGTWAVVRLQAE